MFSVKVALAVLCFAAVANALVSIPDEGLRPPKRPPPPPPPTLPSLPYAASNSPIPVIPVVGIAPAIAAVPIVPPVTRIFPAIPAAPVIPVNKAIPKAPLKNSVTINGPLRLIPTLPTAVPNVEGSFNNPLSQPEDIAPVFRHEVRDQNGQFDIRHSDGKGTVVKESGRLTSTDDGWEYVIVKEGDYSFTSPEGSPVAVKYVADEKGVKATYSIRSQD